ncbi:MAG: hypothetical protein J3Q66DRAFT_335067 [Benniella sp.]|nr:MAG: hypothetical protein J3Q66DRAFT_335067 [Benniella sp.]
MSSGSGYPSEIQQESLYMFQGDKYFSRIEPMNQTTQGKRRGSPCTFAPSIATVLLSCCLTASSVLLRDSDLFMENGSNRQTFVKSESSDNSAFNCAHNVHVSLQPGMQQLHLRDSAINASSAPPTSLIKGPAPVPAPVPLSLFRPSITPFLASSVSAASSSSDGSLRMFAIADRTTTDESGNSHTSSQDMDDMPFTAAQQQATWAVSQPQPLPTSHYQHSIQQLQPYPSVSSGVMSMPLPSSLSSSLSSFTPGIGSSSSSVSGSGGSTDAAELPEEVMIRRAEQNRAAQRAFRQRKQKYIKWLESKAEELDEVYRIMALVRAENQQLCRLVLELDEKLNRMNGGVHHGEVQASSSSSTLPSSESVMRSIPGIDESLGKEISIRLMNLATLPEQGSNSDGDTVMLSKARHSRSSTQSKPTGAKGRMAYKMSQQSKQREALLQAALQSGQLISQQQQQQQQHQQQHQQHLHREQLTGNNHGDQISQQQQSVPWEDRSPTLSIATTEATIPMFNAQLQVDTSRRFLVTSQPSPVYLSTGPSPTLPHQQKREQIPQAISTTVHGFRGIQNDLREMNQISPLNLSPQTIVSIGDQGTSGPILNEL